MTKSTSAKKPASKPIQPLVTKQPQSKEKAAAKAGMFLHTDDSWSAAYFNAQDLHCMERELFG